SNFNWPYSTRSLYCKLLSSPFCKILRLPPSQLSALIHAVTVISEAGFRVGLLGTKISVVEPLNERALLIFPAVQVGTVPAPVLLFPDESAAVVPEASSSFQYPTTPQPEQLGEEGAPVIIKLRPLVVAAPVLT